MEFRVLGPLEVRADGQPLDVGGARHQLILAALLLNPNRVVSVSRLVAAGWGDEAPPTAPRLVRNRVAALRAVLTRVGGLIDTDGDGYRLRVGPGELDAEVFGDLAERGQAAGDAALLRAALGLWRGPVLAGLDASSLEREVAGLTERRLVVWEECLGLELAEGRHDEVAAELAGLVAEHPLRERLVGLWMTALDRCGRRAEALDAYRALADRLADELGIDPSPELRRLRESLRRDESAPTEPTVVPAQLPHDVPGFTGRVGDLARLDNLLSDGQAAPAAVISAIAGTAGVGKTALAMHWAHRVRDKFPDGQLYVNLRGFDPAGSVKAPADALRGFLDALRVPQQRIPAELDGQVRLYRGLLADKRLLIVLDNARDAEQVRPLLPGAPDCLVLITSRRQLTELIAADGARPITLDLLTEDESRQLLARRLGRDRVAAAPAAVDEIVERCARLPLALAIVAARAANEPDSALAVLAGELRDARGDLGPFAGEDPRTDVRAVFSWSYRALTPAAARLFRLLGLHPGPDIAVPAAASLAGLPEDRVRALLAELARSHLIAEQPPGRYACHDLLRAYATEQASAVDSAADRSAALHRVLDHYLHAAYAGSLRLHPHRTPIPVAAAGAGVVALEPAGYEEALAWMTEERAVLVASVEEAARCGFDVHAWQLPAALLPFFEARGRWHDWIATHTSALAAAARLADRPAQARTHRSLAYAYARLGRHDIAHRHLEQALDLYADLDDSTGEAQTRLILSTALGQQGSNREALHHANAALALFEAAGHRAGQARALNAVGWYHGQLGDHRQALDYCERSLVLLQELGARHDEAATWDSVGHAYRHLGDHSRAVESYERAAGLSRDLGDRPQYAEVLTHLGDAHRDAGDHDAARRVWRQALVILQELEQPDDAVRARLTQAG